jgi:hypothetical protein
LRWQSRRLGEDVEIRKPATAFVAKGTR